MLACVCQPTETALLFKGGSVDMGPLGTSKARHTNPDAIKTIKMMPRIVRRFSEDKTSSPSLTSSPSFISSSGSLLNLRKIERTTKSTKILVNPVCSDSLSTSDDGNPAKKGNSKWNGKKKRLKSEIKNGKEYKNDKDESISRKEAREGKKSISCFKIKSCEDKSRSDDDRKFGKENCTNENVSNSIGTQKPDLIRHYRKNSKEILVDESTRTQEESLLKTDQLDTGKTDRAITVKENEVSCMIDDSINQWQIVSLEVNAFKGFRSNIGCIYQIGRGLNSNSRVN